MPYIEDPQARQELEPLCRRPAYDTAELNYQISRLVDRFLQNIDNSDREPHPSVGRVGYNDLSRAHAAMIDAAGEFKVRFMDAYEQTKRVKNKDVYHPGLWGKAL